MILSPKQIALFRVLAQIPDANRVEIWTALDEGQKIAHNQEVNSLSSYLGVQRGKGLIENGPEEYERKDGKSRTVLTWRLTAEGMAALRENTEGAAPAGCADAGGEPVAADTSPALPTTSHEDESPRRKPPAAGRYAADDLDETEGVIVHQEPPGTYAVTSVREDSDEETPAQMIQAMQIQLNKLRTHVLKPALDARRYVPILNKHAQMAEIMGNRDDAAALETLMVELSKEAV
jgi:hypothetical protein